MKVPELLVQTLIWLPVGIAFARHCRHRWVILIVCSGIAASDIFNLASTLSHRNARHAMYLFILEVLAWLPVFILSINAPKSRAHK